MSRRFVVDFLLPLVRGGSLHVGRPLGPSGVEKLARAHAAEGNRPEAEEADLPLADARRRMLTTLVPAPPPCALDHATWFLGAAVHDLLALAHPRIATGPGAESRVERVAAAAALLASLGPPVTVPDALARHSVVARLPELVRWDHEVSYWLGRKTFVGRKPPARILALPQLRGVKVDLVRRSWLRDIGVPAVARPAFVALTEASPLGEALNPLRLDPPLAWGRMLALLRFPVLARLIAGRLVELGVGTAGDALTDALYRFRSLQDPGGPVSATPEALAFVLAFLAHIVWLDHIFERKAVGSAVPFAAGVPTEASGRDLAVMLAAAREVDAGLLWPPDVPAESDLGQRFARHLQLWFERHEVRKSPRWTVALDLARFAAVGMHSLRPHNAV